MEVPRLLRELRRRHVYRVAAAYALTAWLLLQLAAIVLPAFGAPHWVLKALIGLMVLLFPVALLLAWAFELTPEGMRRTLPANVDDARTNATSRRIGKVLDLVIIGILTVAVGVLAWRLSTHSQSDAPPVTSAAIAAATGASQGLAAGTAIAPQKSIAVLPFINDGGNPRERYFSDGLSEDLIIALSQYPELKVIGRYSSFRLRNTHLDSKTIGRELGVTHLLEGSVSHSGNNVRIRVEFVNAADGITLWSDSYDRPYSDLFALQDDITQRVAAALKAKLLGHGTSSAVVQTERPPSGNLPAYEAYLQGEFYFNQRTEKSFRDAARAYQKAIDRDRKYAGAYAGLSLSWSYMAADFLSGAAKTHAFALAKAAADNALRLDPMLAKAHLARGWLLLNDELDWRAAEKAFERAQALAPASTEAKRLRSVTLADLGRLDEAASLGRDVVSEDPLDANAFFDLSLYYSGLDRTDAAEQAIRQAIKLQPAAAAYYAQLALIEIQRNNPHAALQAAAMEPDPAWRTWAFAVAYTAAGDEHRAQAHLHELITRYGDLAPFQIAEIYAYRKHPDQAFAWLERARKQHDPGIGTLLYDPFLMRYRDDPRLAQFCLKVKLPAPASSSAAASI